MKVVFLKINHFSWTLKFKLTLSSAKWMLRLLITHVEVDWCGNRQYNGT